MKLNMSMLLRIAAHIIEAVPAIAAALRPALSELTKPKQTGS